MDQMRTYATQDEILKEKERIIAECEPWSSHNINLGNGIWTVSNEYEGYPNELVRTIGAAAEIFLKRPLRELRILDLASLEGGFSIEMGRTGADVTGIEVREKSVVKARFARDVLGLKNVHFMVGDMHNLPEYNLGTFDLILCCGALYHVDAPKILPFVTQLRNMCSGLTVFDAHVAHRRTERFKTADGQEIYGHSTTEYAPDWAIKNSDAFWNAWDNHFSFSMTERSLTNMIMKAGYSMLTRLMAPSFEWTSRDRATWIAHSPAFTSSFTRDIKASHTPLVEPDPRPYTTPWFQNPIHFKYENPNTETLPEALSDIPKDFEIKELEFKKFKVVTK